MIFIIGIFNYIGLELSGDFNKKQYILLSITPIFSSKEAPILLIINAFLCGLTVSVVPKMSKSSSFAACFISFSKSSSNTSFSFLESSFSFIGLRTDETCSE